MKKLFFYILGILVVIQTYNLPALDSIQEYKDERDHAFVADLIERNKDNFTDADLFPDFVSKKLTVQLPVPEELTQQFPKGISMPIEKQSVFVYCIDTKPVGFVRTWFVHNHVPVSFKSGLIAQVAVVEEHQNKGYGRKLLSYAIEDLKLQGASGISLGSLKHNTRAHKLYESLGFFQAAELPDGQLIFMLQA